MLSGGIFPFLGGQYFCGAGMDSEVQGNDQADRKAVLVLGMHRSGTSALSRMLSLLGCVLPKTLMLASDSNAHGHWESEAAMNLNDAVLASGNSSWDDWLPFDPNWYGSPVAQNFIEQGVGVLREEYGDAPLFVLKDPRNCRLATFWLEVLRREKIEPLVSIPIRNPIEVAASLSARNQMHCDLGQLLWLRHVLDAEIQSRGEKRVFSTYEDLLQNWPDVAGRLDEAFDLWPQLTDSLMDEVSRFLDPGSRHHVHSTEGVLTDPKVSEWLRTTYQIMLRWANEQENSEDYEALDDVRHQFDAAGPVFARLIQEAREDREEAREIRLELERVSYEKIRLESQATQSRHERDEFRIRLGEAERNSAPTLRDQQELLDAQRQNWEARLSEREASLREQEDVVNRGAQELAETRHQAVLLQISLRQEREEMEYARTQLSKDAAALERKTAQWTAFEEECGRVSRALADVQGQLRQAEERQAGLEASLERVAQDLIATSQAREAAEARVREEMARGTGLAEALRTSEAKVVRLEGERATMVVRLEEEMKGKAALSSRLRDQDVKLTSLAQAQERLVAQAARDGERFEWLQQVAAARDGQPRWWALMPLGWRRQREEAALLERGMFDVESYLRHNPDVATAGLNPLRHYMQHGMSEGRSL